MATMDIMARGLLLLSQLLPLSQLLLPGLDMAMDMSAMVMVDMDIMDIMAKDQQKLSPDMAMDMDLAMDMVDMDTMDIMARGPLTPDMAMVDMDMVMVMDMAMVTVMDMDTMVKQ